MDISDIFCVPFQDQRPGTSGLRKKTDHFFQPHYLETFLQAIFNVLARSAIDLRPLIIGGDGRFGNIQAIQTALRIAQANGVRHAMVGCNGILSTPAASHAIRMHKAFGGLIFSASHNPGGPDGDFGVKFNAENGGPAPESLTEEIFKESQRLDRYRIASDQSFPIDTPGDYERGSMRVTAFDPVEDYVRLMQSLFDFDLIRSRLKTGLRFVYDGMAAVTGPYARAIFGAALGLPPSALLNCTPLPDFGGHHPDPNPAHARDLMAIMMGEKAPDLGAASDGDGDRNMIVGPRLPLSPSDSLAVLAANAHLAPGYRHGLRGVARSMPTSRAVDMVAQKLGIPCYETPTGWKFFGTLLDAEKITLCGEESYGTSSNHVREKDGIWAILFWLNILAARDLSVRDILRDHWQTYGRHYYSRHDYENLPAEIGAAVMEQARRALADLQHKEADLTLADDFSYHDPVDGSETSRQGIRLIYENGDRVILRISGTGTSGATLRLYLERFSHDHQAPAEEVLSPLARRAEAIFGIQRLSGRAAPDVVT
ncbi:MAG TPA: alpha-D-glucose phosphate-specific phosphoglucomutase [Dongiaceae bacterium]|jgi:phosphoglucomutase|nr:alpha-D-glucose phosphate-specific phosphoglucomutase [Dongiaceae bacterium]